MSKSFGLLLIKKKKKALRHRLQVLSNASKLSYNNLLTIVIDAYVGN